MNIKLIGIIIVSSFVLAGCPVKQSDDELVASKCRLKIPIQKEQCEAVGVYGTKGGQLQGLPVGGKDGLDR